MTLRFQWRFFEVFCWKFHFIQGDFITISSHIYSLRVFVVCLSRYSILELHVGTSPYTEVVVDDTLDPHQLYRTKSLVFCGIRFINDFGLVLGHKHRILSEDSQLRQWLVQQKPTIVHTLSFGLHSCTFQNGHHVEMGCDRWSYVKPQFNDTDGIVFRLVCSGEKKHGQCLWSIFHFNTFNISWYFDDSMVTFFQIDELPGIRWSVGTLRSWHV